MTNREVALDRDEVLAILVAQVRAVVPELAAQPVSAEDTMAGLGLDSTERHEALVGTLEALSLDVPLVQLHGLPTLGAFADRLHANLAS
jgi:polyketide biosynthesis acyl carrier protein